MSSSRFGDGGSLIDPSQRLPFTFDGRRYEGFSGDTLASALLASGVQLMGRSFKYHRPRSLVSGGASEPNALVTVGEGARREPNLRASMVELSAGLVAESQNRWPSLGFDAGAVNSALSPFIGAGFYYKTFMWPAAFWEKFYEPAIRRAAGLGRASHMPDSATYEKCWAHCDLLVIGAGPAGLSAALAAARAGARVILCDEMAEPGGRLLGDKVEIGDGDGPAFARSALAELSAASHVTVLARTSVFGAYDSGVYGAVERVADDVGPAQRIWRIIARRAILATGAEERPLVFGNNDRPGIMTASAMRALAHGQAVRPGERLAIFTTGPSGHETARALADLGVEITAVIDSRTEIPEPELETTRGLPVMAGHVLADAKGGKLVSGGRVIDRATGRGEKIFFDALAVSGGYSPRVQLACQRGDRPVWEGDRGMFLPPAPRDGLEAAGSAAGAMTLEACLSSGQEAAHRALEALGKKPRKNVVPKVREACGGSSGFATLWHVGEAKKKAFVDFQNDVSVDDLQLAVREGYGHVELAKRYTTTGMATDQGKLSNINAIGILAEARGLVPGQVGTTTFRPFTSPVTIGALAGAHAGAHYRPVRRSPLHRWAEKHGAVFIEAGPWMRPSHYLRDGESGWKEACDRETLNVRKAVGISDASTLGKIDVTGRDAARFLDRIYTGTMSTLKAGRARYGLMLREDGLVMDDGTVSRFGEDHFVVTTTTGAAGEAMAHLEFCQQALWPEMDVNLVSVTDAWAQIAVAGPLARAVMARVVAEDLSEEALPFMTARTVRLHSGEEARLFRISFSGELGYELAVPADRGEAVADALLEAGAPFGIQPYGLEALNVLRIEKGFITHSEIDGRTTPGDLGLGRMVGAKKEDFIGKAMLAREGLQRDHRLQLVGLKPLNSAHRLLAGAHLLEPGAVPSMENDQGHVSSACWSPHLESAIGLAMLKHGRARHGETLTAWDPLRGIETTVEVVDPLFLPAPDAGASLRRNLPPVVAGRDAESAVRDADLAVGDAVRLTACAAVPICLVHGRPSRQAAIIKLAASGDGIARRIAPGQALAVGQPGESRQDLMARLAAAAGPRIRLLDLTGGRSRYELSGSAARAVLAAHTFVDTAPEKFRPGASTPTMFGHVSGQLTCTDDGVYEIMTFSTYGQDLAESLARMARGRNVLG